MSSFSNASTNASTNALPFYNGSMDIYVPRINPAHTEENVREVFANQNIGYVEYVDFVKSKPSSDLSVPTPVYYSAFIKVAYHGDKSENSVHTELLTNGSYKLHLNRSEFWVLLPNKTPLPRTKVNVHQLAQYTDELYQKTSDIESKITEQSTANDEVMKAILSRLKTLEMRVDMQSSRIAQQDEIIQEQSEKMQEYEYNIDNLMTMSVYQEKKISILTRTVTTLVSKHTNESNESNELNDSKTTTCIESNACNEDNCDIDIDEILGLNDFDDLSLHPIELTRGEKIRPQCIPTETSGFYRLFYRDFDESTQQFVGEQKECVKDVYTNTVVKNYRYDDESDSFIKIISPSNSRVELSRQLCDNA
jgi:hypothetical protein